MKTTPDLIAHDINVVAEDDLHCLNFGEEYASATARFTSVVDGRVREYKADGSGVVNAYNLPVPMTYKLEVGEFTFPLFYVTTRYLCGIQSILTHGKNKNIEPERYGATEEDAWIARAAATEHIEHAAQRHFTPYVEQQARYLIQGAQFMLDWPDVEFIGREAKENLWLLADSFALGATTGHCVFCYISGLKIAPHAIRRAAKVLAASYLTPTRIPDRAMAESTDNHYVRFSIEGKDGPTGIPAVDAAIEEYGRKRLRVW